MVISRELIDFLEPKHWRTSCDDLDPCNGCYEIEDETLRGVLVRREFKYGPRCNRCFLLQFEGTELPSNIRLSVYPELVQPEFTIAEGGSKHGD